MFDPELWKRTKVSAISLLVGGILLIPAGYVLFIAGMLMVMGASDILLSGAREAILFWSALVGSCAGILAWMSLCLLMFQRRDIRVHRLAWHLVRIAGIIIALDVGSWFWLLIAEETITFSSNDSLVLFCVLGLILTVAFLLIRLGQGNLRLTEGGRNPGPRGKFNGYLNDFPDPRRNQPKMRISSILALFLGVFVTGAATARTFTSLKGVSIQAEIATATATTVTLKEPSGNKVTVSLNQLVPADRNYIQLWLAENLPEIRVKPSFVRSTRNPRDKTGSHNKSKDGKQVQVLNMSVDIESWDTDRGLEDGELVYTLVGRSTEHRNRYKILAVQNSNFTVPPAGHTKVDFKTVENYFEDNKDKARGARCVGYVLRAKRRSDNREVWSSASSPVLEKAIAAIAGLQAGEETNDEFIPIPDPPAAGKEGGKDVIKVE